MPTGLVSDDVHVWWVDLDTVRVPRLALTAYLGGDERARVAALRAEADRRLYAVAHIALGDILRGYGVRGPLDRRCRLCGDPDHGKPHVRGGGVDVNLSHAGRRAVVAVIRRPNLVGVDVELASSITDVPAIRRALGRRIDDLADDGAYATAWCRAEAVGKATGHGIVGTAPLVRVTHRVTDAQGTWRRGIDEEGRPWRLHDLDAGDGYVGALAVMGGPVALTHHRWGWPMGRGRSRGGAVPRPPLIPGGRLLNPSRWRRSGGGLRTQLP
jgi:4'-phosphopantetheinyl transferase